MNRCLSYFLQGMTPFNFPVFTSHGRRPSLWISTRFLVVLLSWLALACVPVAEYDEMQAKFAGRSKAVEVAQS